MKPKTTLMLLVVMAVVGLFYWFWGVKGEAERERQEDLASRIIPVESDSVDEVTLVQNGDSVLTYKRLNNQWQITRPVMTQADQNKIETNLNAFLDAKKKRTIATELTDLKPYGLDRPQATIHIGYSDTGKVVLDVGEQNPTQSGVYVKREDSPNIYTTLKKVLTEGQKGLFDLRDRSILHFTRNEINKIILTRDDGSKLVFNKLGNDWRMQEPRVRVQNSQVSTLLRSLSTGSAQEYFAERADNLEQYGIAQPSTLVSLFRNDSTRVATLAIGDQVDEGDSPDYYAKDLRRPMVFSVRNNVASKLNQPIFDFQDKTLFDINRNQVTDITIQRQDSTYQLTEIDTVWQLTSPVQGTVEEDEATTLARKLSTLRMDELETYAEAASLPRYGLDTPWLKIEFKISGSTFDGLVVGDSAGNDMRYMKLVSLPYIYKIKESKLTDFQVSSGDLIVPEDKTVMPQTESE